MLISKTTSRHLLRGLLKKNFGSSHYVYDWRTDPKYNPYHTTDYSDVGINQADLQSPTVAPRTPLNVILPPEGVDISSPNVNFNYHSTPIERRTITRAPDWDHKHDVDHEADFGSEDMDFQPECYKTQHFHKQGWIWPWVIVAFAGLLYVGFELGYAHYPDHNFFKKPRPLPFSNAETSWSKKDQNIYENRERFQRFAIDSGASEPRWKIENKNFVFDRFAGVNQPQQPV